MSVELQATQGKGGWLSRLTGWVVSGREQAAPEKEIRDAARLAEGRESDGARRTLLEVVGTAWEGARSWIDSDYAREKAAREHDEWFRAEEEAARRSGLGRDATTSGPVVRSGRAAMVDPLDPEIIARHASAWVAFSLHAQKSVSDGVIQKADEAVILAAGSAALSERLRVEAGNEKDAARYEAKVSERMAAMLGMTPERLRESRRSDGVVVENAGPEVGVGALGLDQKSVRWSIKSTEWYFNNSGGSHDVRGAIELIDQMVSAGNAALGEIDKEAPDRKLPHINDIGGLDGTSGLKQEAIAAFIGGNITPGAVLNAQTAYHALVEQRREPERSRLPQREQGMVVMAVRGFAEQVAQAGGLSAFHSRGGMAHILRDGVERHGAAAALASLERSRGQVETVLSALRSLKPGQFRDAFLTPFDGRGGDVRARALSDGQSNSFAVMSDEQATRIRDAMIDALETRRDFHPQKQMDGDRARFQAAHDFVQAARDLLAPAHAPNFQQTHGPARDELGHGEWGHEWSHGGLDTALRTLPVEQDYGHEPASIATMPPDHAVGLDALRDSLWRIAGQTGREEAQAKSPDQTASGFDAIWSDPVAAPGQRKQGMLSDGAWNVLKAVQQRLDDQLNDQFDPASLDGLSPETALQVARMSRAAETLSAHLDAPGGTEIGRLATALNDILAQRGANIAAEKDRKALAVSEVKTAMIDIERRYAGLDKPAQPDGKALSDVLFAPGDLERVVEALDRIAAYAPPTAHPKPQSQAAGAPSTAVKDRGGERAGILADSVRPALGRNLQAVVEAATLNLVKADLAKSLKRDLAGRDERLLSDLVDGPRPESVSAVISRMRGGLAYLGEASTDRALAEIDNRYRATREIGSAITALTDAAGREIGNPKSLTNFLVRIAENPALLADKSERPVASMHNLYGDMRRWVESGNAPEESRKAATAQLRVLEANFRSLGVDLAGDYQQRLDKEVRRQAADNLVARLHEVTRNAKPKPELLGDLIEHIKSQATNPTAKPIRQEWVALLNLAERPPRGTGEPDRPVSESLAALRIDRGNVLRVAEPSVAREQILAVALTRNLH